MSMIVTWRKYTKAERHAYRVRELRRRVPRRVLKDIAFGAIYGRNKVDPMVLEALGWEGEMPWDRKRS